MHDIIAKFYEEYSIVFFTICIVFFLIIITFLLYLYKRFLTNQVNEIQNKLNNSKISPSKQLNELIDQLEHYNDLLDSDSKIQLKKLTYDLKELSIKRVKYKNIDFTRGYRSLINLYLPRLVKFLYNYDTLLNHNRKSVYASIVKCNNVVESVLNDVSKNINLEINSEIIALNNKLQYDANYMNVKNRGDNIDG